jgi:uncharacterized protein (DUF2235 family)
MTDRPLKRLVFCFDGTSNTLDREHPTNVAITAAAVRNTSPTGPQIVYYDEGVGSTNKDDLMGGAFGAGLYDKVVEAYKFLVFNHEPGDEIFIFGFSRGAYTARSFAGLIHHVGVVNSCFADKIKVATALYQNRPRDRSEDQGVLQRFRQEFVTDCCASDDDLSWRREHVPGFGDTPLPLVNIRYVGVWDTVKTIGSSVFGDRDRDDEFDAAEFHDHNLHPTVHSARHAVAIDERRKKFDVTLWDNVDALNKGRGFAVDDPNRPYQQVWFPGGHGSVGGGGDLRGLSDEALEWVLDGAKAAGLKLDTSTVSKVWGIRPDVLEPLENSSKLGWSPKELGMRMLPKADRNGPKAMHEIAAATIVRWGAPEGLVPERKRYRPKPLQALAAKLDAAAATFQPWEYEARGGYAKEGAAPKDARTSDGRTLRRHIVASGESLRSIATARLGSAGRASEIAALNRTTLLDPDRLYARQELNLPAA